jgi:hypothetical protein
LAVSMQQGREKLYVALALLGVVAALAWFTLDPAAGFLVEGRRVPLRLPVMLILALFAFRIVMAHLRSRYDVE